MRQMQQFGHAPQHMALMVSQMADMAIAKACAAWNRAGSPPREPRVQAIGRQPQRAPDGALVHCERHRPEQITLYRLAQQRAVTFIAETEAAPGAGHAGTSGNAAAWPNRMPLSKQGSGIGQQFGDGRCERAVLVCWRRSACDDS